MQKKSLTEAKSDYPITKHTNIPNIPNLLPVYRTCWVIHWEKKKKKINDWFLFRFSEPLEHHQLCHFLDVIAQGGKSNSFFPHSNHRRLFCDELCQLYDVIYKTRCPTVFHTERHQSSIIGNFHIFCDRNENNDGLVVFCGDLSFHWYKDVRNRYA